MDFEYIKNELIKNSEYEYKIFSSKLIPNIDNVLGVRLPFLRKLAKKIAKNDIAENFIYNYDDIYFEETMLKGLVIGYIDCDINKRFLYCDFFVPKINCWSICDSFCNTLKSVKEYKELTFKYLDKYINSDKEYYNRFAIVMYMTYFIDEQYIDKIFKYFDNVKSKEYYAQMSIAWALSMFYIKFPDKTLNYLMNCNLLDFTYNKTLQKIIESRQVSNEDKNFIRTLKRKG